MKIALMGESPEIFHSLQGEGVSLGRPAVFIRLALCNLKCEWCDTAYTWSREAGKHKEKIIDITPRKAAEIISQFPCRHVIVTGGEPLLQDKAVVELMEFLPGHTFEIETNGTLIPSGALDQRTEQYNVSPKLKHSGNSDIKSLVPASLQWFAGSEKAWFKFVIGDLSDIDEVADLENTVAIPHDRILLMPKGTTVGKLVSIRAWLTEECLKRNYRFTDRLHIHLWGNKQGV